MNPESAPEFDEVLLTAYLDDEVTDAERAMVEKQLRTSESSRKLLEELRSVRNLVVQLHISQPSRNFQQGPWNDKTAPLTTPEVALNSNRFGWNMSLQRLASLAAMIAIATCVSVLMFGPKRGEMARTDSVKRKDSPASPAERVAQDAPIDSFEFTPAAPTPALENAPSLAEMRAEGPNAKEDAKQESLGRVGGMSLEAPMLSGGGMPGAGAAASGGKTSRLERKSENEVESSATVLSNAGGSAPVTAGSGGLSGTGGFGSSAPAKPMSKQKADTTDFKRVDPTPAETRMLAESDAGASELGSALAPAPAKKSAPTELYFALPRIQQQSDGEWLALNDRKDAASLGDKEVRGLSVKESEDGAKILPSQARYTYRFRGPPAKNDKASFDGLDDQAEKRSAAIAPIALNEGASEKKIDDVAIPLMVELQIPLEKWEQGSKSLRQMGFKVPIEMPRTGYLDYIADQILEDAAAGLGNTTNTAARSEPSGKMRIRVRTIP